MTTVVDYSIMMYYTKEFRGTFSSLESLEAFVDKVITIVNQGYNNSKIPVSCYPQKCTVRTELCTYFNPCSPSCIPI